MSVGYTSDTDKAPATGTTIEYTSFAVSGVNPVILVCIALKSTTATVSSVVCSAGLTSGTPVEVIAVRDDTGGTQDSFVSIWAIPAPSGTGTITVTLSASVPWQSHAILMAGAHQTTPCPLADAASSIAAGSPQTVTPANLTADDAAVGIGCNTDGDAPLFGQTETFNNNTTAVNAAAGYHLGTGSVSVSWTSTPSCHATIGVRVAAAGGAGNDLNVSSIGEPVIGGSLF